jgi:putative ABC transport system substrate-binding protein
MPMPDRQRSRHAIWLKSQQDFVVLKDAATADEVVQVRILERVCAMRHTSFFVRALVAISLVLGVITLSNAWAQARTNIPKIGILSFGPPPSGTDPDPDRGVRQGLHELGYIEGRNIFIERRYADGMTDRLAAQAAELVRLHVDVILANGPATLEAARKASSSIPIVTISGSDPVRAGWAMSLAHPGGNVTGLTVTFPGLDLKRLEILKEAFPAISRVAVLTEFHVDQIFKGELDAGARRLKLELQFIEVPREDEIDRAFAIARQGRAQALIAIATNLVVSQRSRLAELATADRMLSISEFPLMAQAGFLLTYGADLDDLGRRSIAQIDKILKGSRAGEMPVERPTKFRLVVNLKTGNALGLAIPQSLLLRADEVIQ